MRKTEAKKSQVNLFKVTQLEREKAGFPTLASETELINSKYTYTYQIFALELRKQILAQGKFKFSRRQTSDCPEINLYDKIFRRRYPLVR